MRRPPPRATRTDPLCPYTTLFRSVAHGGVVTGHHGAMAPDSRSTPEDSSAPTWTSLERGALMFGRSEEHTSELQSLMRISYAVFCLKKKKCDDGRLHKDPQLKIPTTHIASLNGYTPRRQSQI